MATQAQLIYDIKNIASGFISTSEIRISNRQILFWINSERTKLIRQYYVNNPSGLRDVIQELECVNVECKSVIECCEESLKLPPEAIIGVTEELPSIIQIPDFTNGLPFAFTYVGSLDGLEEFNLTTPAQARWQRYRRFTNRDKMVYYLNNRFYITNPKGVELIAVRGIFADPSELKEFITCEGTKCYDPDEEKYPIPDFLIPDLQQAVLNKLIAALQIGRKDLENNSLEDARQQQ